MLQQFSTWFLTTFKLIDEKEESQNEQLVVDDLKKTELDNKRYISRHAEKRFEERHGEVFSNEKAKEIILKIRNKDAEFLQEQHNNTEEWIAECNSKKYRILYSLEKDQIVTVFPGYKKKKKKYAKKEKILKINGRQQTKFDRKRTTYKRIKNLRYEEYCL